MIFVSHTQRTNGDVFVAWCPPGTIDAMVRAVRDETPGVDLIDFAPASKCSYEAWTQSMSPSRTLGRWFARTPEFTAAMPLSLEAAL